MSNPPVIARYGVAVVSVTAALIGSQVLERYLVPAPASLFLCAVMFSAWFGGLRPGLLATALSVLVFAYYFTAPLYSLLVDTRKYRACSFLPCRPFLSVFKRRTKNRDGIAETGARQIGRNSARA